MSAGKKVTRSFPTITTEIKRKTSAHLTDVIGEFVKKKIYIFTFGICVLDVFVFQENLV